MLESSQRIHSSLNPNPCFPKLSFPNLSFNFRFPNLTALLYAGASCFEIRRLFFLLFASGFKFFFRSCAWNLARAWSWHEAVKGRQASNFARAWNPEPSFLFIFRFCSIGARGPASGGSFFLRQLPLLIEVQSWSGGYRRSHGDQMKGILLWWKERRGRRKRKRGNFGLWEVN
ncbi:hypothetical protein VNO80_05346 [Phaseolus coccineus]|uniref:Uncharacterized protein n=1 Tax=Phaseolus coccineus TaxID=3886 RepID=A0AAN9NJZ0_PHACN